MGRAGAGSLWKDKVCWIRRHARIVPPRVNVGAQHRTRCIIRLSQSGDMAADFLLHQVLATFRGAPLPDQEMADEFPLRTGSIDHDSPGKPLRSTLVPE